MGKVISFFNHKGGVGKTTLAHNIAFALADQGKHVLLIDADPQMNLTAAMYGLSTAIEYSTNNNSTWYTYTQKYISLSEYLQQHLEDTPCLKEKFKTTKTRQGSIELIAGDINLTTIESNIYGIIGSNNNFFQKIPGKFERSIKTLTKEYDFVLIDTSPSATSIINALLVLTSDYFIAPVSPSFFSLQAIDNLSTIFQNRKKLLLPFIRTTGFPDGIQFTVKFAGIVVQLAKRFNGGGKANMDGFSKDTEVWIKDVNNSASNFHQYGSNTGNSITHSEFQRMFGDNATPFIIEKCCDFTPKLRAIAEKEGIPVIYITQDICKKYDKKVDIEKSSSQYHKAFTAINQQYRNIANNLLNLG